MRIRMDSITVSEDDRGAVAHQFGEHGELASRDTMRQYLEDEGLGGLEEIAMDHGNCPKCREARGLL